MNTPRLPGLAAGACCLSLLVAHATAIAGPLGDRLRARLEGQPSPAQTTEPDLDEGMEAFRASGRLPTGVVRLADRAYGPHSAQRYDVYLPSRRPMQTMPIIVMAHGGGWAHGDKAHAPVVDNKVRRWVPRNVALVSVNYPMLPETPPLEQARHVARALASVQRDAPSWGGDPRQVVLMGHSAGAHLVALLTAHPPFTQAEGALPWLGTVSLDSAAFDVVAVMSGRHLALYDRAFGTARSDWVAASPLHQLTRMAAPMLAVCSSRRADACPQARSFAAAIPSDAPEMHILPVPQSHGDINATLGKPGSYTDAVERFIEGLPGWSVRLSGEPSRR